MQNEQKRIVIQCPLCSEKALNVVNDGPKQLMQCINCGYSTSDDYLGKIKDNKSFEKLDEGLKKFAKEANGQIWIPAVLSLDAGMFYPIDIKNELNWAFSPLVEIPLEEQKNYPVPGEKDKFYDKKYDTDNQITYEDFGKGIKTINDTLARLKQEHNRKKVEKMSDSPELKKLKLPKLKKMK